MATKQFSPLNFVNVEILQQLLFHPTFWSYTASNTAAIKCMFICKQARNRWIKENENKLHVHLPVCVRICICMEANMCVHANGGPQVFLDLCVCVRKCVCGCAAAPSQPSAPPAGKGPGLRHQLQAGMRMAESQTDTAVGYYVWVRPNTPGSAKNIAVTVVTLSQQNK